MHCEESNWNEEKEYKKQRRENDENVLLTTLDVDLLQSPAVCNTNNQNEESVRETSTLCTPIGKKEKGGIVWVIHDC